MGAKDRKDAISTLFLLSAILLGGFLLRVIYLTEDRFHADEALYAGWALRILGGDTFLLSVPVDKPPLYLFTVAGSMWAFGDSEVTARLPSLAASLVGIALVYRLGIRLYGRATGTWAALFVALSPFDILFARTAFTDPMLVTWTLGALCATVEDRWFWAGVCLGLAFATKQHAVVLIPLVALVGWTQRKSGFDQPGSDARPERGRRDPDRSIGDLRGLCVLRASVVKLSIVTLGFSIPFALVTWWDAVRWEIRPGYWQQSALSYGGLAWAAFDRWGERFLEWLGWARYLSGSIVLGVLLLLGCSALLIRGWRREPRRRGTWFDTVFVGYALGYLLVHTLLKFSIWDRYLLFLVPLTGLLLARIVVRGMACFTAVQVCGGKAAFAYLRVLCVSVVCVVSLLSAWKAAHNGYPVGGEHWAYQGLDQVTAYLKENAPSDAVLYHHWLRWHYTYYLYDTDFELRWWQSGEHLRREATRTPERAQYIVLPDWRTLEPDAEGVHFEPVYETRRRDDSVSLRVYRVKLEF